MTDAQQPTEMARLVSRFFGDPDRTLLNFRVTWGPGAAALSVEERAAIINRALDQGIDATDTPPDSGPAIDVREMFRGA